MGDDDRTANIRAIQIAHGYGFRKGVAVGVFMMLAAIAAYIAGAIIS